MVVAETEEKTQPKLSKKLEDLLKSIEEMSVLELTNFVKAIEEKFGVTAAAPIAFGGAASGGGAAGAQAAQAEEKATFTLVLAKVGDNKIQVIKEIRAITTLGLKEAKDLVEAAPKPFKEGVPKEEAETIKKKFEGVGAVVELK